MTKIATTLASKDRLSHRLAYGFVRNTVTIFSLLWCRMEVEGRENVPTEGIFILAPTHRSILDTPIASGVTRRRMRFMGADKWWSNKWFGKLLSLLGGFPVSRGTADREALKRCIELLEGGEPLVMFPEGERKSGPIVQPLFEGATYIAMKTGAAIVPVGIGGSERAMPKGAKFIYPRKLHVVVGKPMRVPVAETSKLQRDATRALTKELYAELQRLFDIAQARVGK
ncbi:MAG: lysophospholipid acyltransferase family protein [Actinomycetota bacterium]